MDGWLNFAENPDAAAELVRALSAHRDQTAFCVGKISARYGRGSASPSAGRRKTVL
jgi:hypothetical protein